MYPRAEPAQFYFIIKRNSKSKSNQKYKSIKSNVADISKVMINAVNILIESTTK